MARKRRSSGGRMSCPAHAIARLLLQAAMTEVSGASSAPPAVKQKARKCAGEMEPSAGDGGPRDDPARQPKVSP